MKYYSDANRGTFQDIRHARQLISFEGMKYKGRSGICNVTPTDIDGAMRLEIENCVVLFELKRYGEMPNGQRCALVDMVDLMSRGGADCILFVAQHDTDDDEIIIAKDSIVTEVYWKGQWWDAKDKYTLGEFIDKYISYLDSKLDSISLTQQEPSQCWGCNCTKMERLESCEDTISRHAAITLPVMPKEHREYQTHNLDDAYEQGWNDLQKCIESLPSTQPQLPEWAQKVEEYRQSAPSHIHNPLAWALYQTWKEYDR